MSFDDVYYQQFNGSHLHLKVSKTERAFELADAMKKILLKIESELVLSDLTRKIARKSTSGV